MRIAVINCKDSENMTELDRKIDNYMAHAHHPQLNSILVWENGEMLAERYYNGYDSESRHQIKSVVKSILSIAVGIAADDGLLSIDDPIGKYIPEFAENRDVLHRKITVRHLLTMSSGIFWQGGVHYTCPLTDGMRRSRQWVDFIADCKVVNIPGAKHLYKEWDVILLAVILSKVSGDCYDFIDNRIYKPLGITSERWYKSPDGAYYSVAFDEEKEKQSNLSAKDMLKLGILFMQDGMWNGKRIVSKEYIEQATKPSPQAAHYGFLWWVGTDYYDMRGLEGKPPVLTAKTGDWYACRGFGGQTVTVFKESGRIVVTQATVTNRPLDYSDVIFDVALDT